MEVNEFISGTELAAEYEASISKQESQPQSKEEEVVVKEFKSDEPIAGESTEAIEATEVKDIEESTQIDFAKLNESLGGGYESIDDIKNKLGSYSKLAEYEKQIEEYKGKYNGLKDKVGVTKEMFANPEIMKINEVIKKYPDKDPSLMFSIIEGSIDVENIEGQLDALLKHEKLTNGTAQSFKDEVLLKSILKRSGVDVDDEDVLMNPENWSDIAKYELKRQAGSAKSELEKFKSIETPEYLDFESIEQQAQQEAENRKAQWTDKSNEIAKSFDKLEINLGDGEVFEFDVDQAFKDIAPSVVLDRGLGYGVMPDEDVVNDAKTWIKDHYIALNINKIATAIKNQTTTKLKEQHLKELHNEGKPNKKESPVSEVEINEFLTERTPSQRWRQGI